MGTFPAAQSCSARTRPLAKILPTAPPTGLRGLPHHDRPSPYNNRRRTNHYGDVDCTHATRTVTASKGRRRYRRAAAPAIGCHSDLYINSSGSATACTAMSPASATSITCRMPSPRAMLPFPAERSVPAGTPPISPTPPTFTQGAALPHVPRGPRPVQLEQGREPEGDCDFGPDQGGQP